MMPDDCNACGDCCRTMVLPLPHIKGHALEKDHERWIELHGLDIINIQGRRAVRIPVACTMLDDQGKCKIYQDRPIMCKQGKCPKNNK